MNSENSIAFSGIDGLVNIFKVFWIKKNTYIYIYNLW